MKAKESLRKQYRDFEIKVLHQLRTIVENSPTNSIDVNLYDYTQLVIRHDELVFIDRWGLEYSLFTDTNLEDLIEIIEQH